MDTTSQVKLFALANSLTENALDKVENDFNTSLGRKEKNEEIIEKKYYAQFDARFRKEAKEMSEHYEVFYCLERSIRSLVIELMKDKFGDNWWEEKVRDDIKKNVQNNIQTESDSGYTQRSEEKIDYTTFGELSEIVISNWDAFDDLFGDSKRAFQRIMSSLNLLRGPIAHCCPLAPDEVTRLEVVVKDWLRLMS